MGGLIDEFAFAIQMRRRPALEVQPAVAVWRDQRSAIVPLHELRPLRGGGAGRSSGRAVGSQQRPGGPAHVAPLESTPSAAPRLDASEIAAAEESTTLLRRAQIILATLTAVLRPRYDEFIGMTAVRGAWEFLRRRKRLPLKTAPRIFCLESESLASTLP